MSHHQTQQITDRELGVVIPIPNLVSFHLDFVKHHHNHDQRDKALSRSLNSCINDLLEGIVMENRSQRGTRNKHRYRSPSALEIPAPIEEMFDGLQRNLITRTKARMYSLDEGPSMVKKFVVKYMSYDYFIPMERKGPPHALPEANPIGRREIHIPPKI